MSTETKSNRKWGVPGAVLIAALMALALWNSGSTEPQAEEAPRATASEEGASTGDGRGASQAPAPATASMSVPPEGVLQPVPCALDSLVEEYRQGKGSPAWRRYVMQQLRGLLETLPAEELWAKLEAEGDPEVLEALSSLWVTRFNLTGDRSILERVLDKASRESDPARRAVMVRALRASDEPASEVLAKAESTRQAYREWVRDSAPELREAVVGNLAEEAARNFGRFQGVAEQAVALAAEAEDPKTAAGLLAASSIEAVRAPAVASVRELLQESEHPEVRGAAARALGTVAVPEAERTLRALSERFVTERDATVRSAILESIAHLGLGRSIPVLQKLKGVDRSMDGEIETWLTLLASHPQTWNLLLRDKQARELGRSG